MQKSSLFDQIYHNYRPMTFEYAHATNLSNINKYHHTFTKIHTEQKDTYNALEKHNSYEPACL